MGTFGLSEKNRVTMLIIEHHVWETELWVHVSRLLMLHLDRDQWKHTWVNTKQWSLSIVCSKIIQHAFTDVLDGLGIRLLGFLTISYSNGFRSQQFSHFIPIDASQLFITEHPAGEAGYSVMSFLQCLAQGQGKGK